MRNVLPVRRAHDTVALEFWSKTWTIGLGRAAPGTHIQEVFVNCGRSGEQLEILARDSAVLLSIALQHGVPLETMRHAITRNPDGSPMGPVGAILDLIHGEERGND